MTDEAKRIVYALKACGRGDCLECNRPEDAFCTERLKINAADLIERMADELEQVKRERDAAVHDLAINRSCAVCKNEAGFKCAANGCAHENEWQWRGVCAENSKDGAE